ncbi:MAG: putative lipid II flippase FtsW, partial [Candidatus Binatia bacterium]
MARKRKRIRVRASDKPDPWLLGLTFVLVVAGLLFVLDTTYFFSRQTYGDSYRMFIKHSVSVVLGLVLMLGLSRCRSDILERAAPWLMGVATLLLLLPLVPGVGTCTHGACRWISLGPVNVQPGELLKWAFVVFIAALLTARSDQLSDWRFGLFPVLGIMAVLGAVLMKQPDFGTTVLIGALGLGLMLLAGVPLYQVGALGVLGAAAAGIMVYLEPYRVKRVISFLNPDLDPLGSNWQLKKSLLTFGSGEWFGVGIGSSRLKTGYLPEAHTDFIFSVVGEETGVLGAGLILLCFSLLAYRGFRIAHRHPDMFGQMLAAGFTMAITLQAFINMGVVLGLLPTKGMALPFI